MQLLPETSTATHEGNRILRKGAVSAQKGELLVVPLNMRDFVQSMNNVYSTSVSKKTLDEAPQAYKPKAEILQAIEPTAEILAVLQPMYNFKAP